MQVGSGRLIIHLIPIRIHCAGAIKIILSALALLIILFDSTVISKWIGINFCMIWYDTYGPDLSVQFCNHANCVLCPHRLVV